jgi:archaellum biogenesis protein FlaJ (TadC family)
MEDFDGKRVKRIGRFVSLGVALVVFVALNFIVPKESRSAITFLFFAGIAYGISLLLFFLYRTAAASGWLQRFRIRSRVYYISKQTYVALWVGAVLLSMLSLVGGVITRSGGLRFLLLYLIPVVLIGAVSLISTEDEDDLDY